MTWRGSIVAAVVAASLALSAPSALASETVTALQTGGIDIVGASPDSILQLDAEEMTISPETILISYRMTNLGDVPLDLSMRFPYPDLDFSDPDAAFAIPGSDPVNFLGATFKIDGKAVAFSTTQKAVANEKDVTAQLRRAKLALVPIGTFQNDVSAMAPDRLAELVAADLIKEAGTTAEGTPIFFPTWAVVTLAMRKVTIPPKKTMAVDVRYLTSVGVSRDTMLRKALRDQKSLAAQVKSERIKYCIDDAFMNGLDAIAGAGDANQAALAERRISIAPRRKDQKLSALQYRLVIDKAKPQRIVSSCLQNLKKISATSFEQRSENYVPPSQLDVLFIDKGDAVAR